jgi:hypothetical protein
MYWLKSWRIDRLSAVRAGLARNMVTARTTDILDPDINLL